VLAVPLIVGFARVYVGAHLPLDVVGGWAIGVTVSCGVHLIFGVPVEEDAGRDDRGVR
jgi:undecaprenyl-diphosphatase